MNDNTKARSLIYVKQFNLVTSWFLVTLVLGTNFGLNVR